MPKSNKHILVIRLSAMGDVAMFVPVLRAILAQNTHIKITVLSQPFFAPFFKEIPNVSFIAIDKKNKHKGFLGLIALAKQLVRLKPYAIADIHNVLRTNILVRIARLYGVPFKQIDKGRAEKRALTQAKNKTFIQLKTTHERYATVFRALGCKVDLSTGIFPEKQVLNTPLVPKTNQPKIGIAPFAAHKGKQYPIQLMERVISELSTTHQVILFGSKSEAPILEKIENKYKNCISIAAKTSFEEELQLISNLDIMVAMDSGNAHLAAMYGVKVITIWGVTHPFAGFAPFNQLETNNIIPNLKKYPLIPTSIYGNKYPEGYLECFETILPETIIKKVKELV